MAVFETDSGSLSELVVTNRLAATGSLFGTASFANNASFAQQQSVNVSVNGFTQGPIGFDATSENVSQLVFSNINGLSFGLNGSTITATYQNTGGDTFTYSYGNPRDAYVQALGTWGSGTLFMQPIQIPNVQFDRVAIPIYISKPGNNNSNLSLTLSMRWGLYTRDVSTFNLLTDYSSMSSIQSIVSNTNNSLYDGVRLFTLGLTNTLTEGQYYAAVLSNITTGGQGTISNIVISQQASSFFGLFGQAYNRTVQYTRGLGFYSTSTNDLPSAIAISELFGAATYTTAAASATQILRPPAFYMVSETV